MDGPLEKGLRRKRLRRIIFPPCMQDGPAEDSEDAKDHQLEGSGSGSSIQAGNFTISASGKLATEGGSPAERLSYPTLGPGLRTFVINLARRPDRREHIESLCEQLNLKCEVVEACDGQALAAQEGARFEVLSGPATARDAQRSKKGSGKAQSKAKPKKKKRKDGRQARGFEDLRTYLWCTYFDWEGKTSQKLRMAEHRLKPSERTTVGHELWGAVGCSLSHQEVLRRIAADPSLEWALVLEDDASLGKFSAAEVQKVFNSEMRLIAQRYPSWELIYLGGHISSHVKKKDKESWQKTTWVKAAEQVYQTHAFIIRKSLIPVILAKLEEGLAADAAFVSWSRSTDSNDKCFLFHPKMLLIQPGGAGRWKDSDIFIHGEFFKDTARKQAGGTYNFTVAIKSRRKITRMKKIRRQKLLLSAYQPRAPLLSPRWSSIAKRAESQLRKHLKDASFLAAVESLHGDKKFKVHIPRRAEAKVCALEALRTRLTELAASVELRVQMRHSALLDALKYTASFSCWQRRLVATARFLHSTSAMTKLKAKPQVTQHVSPPLLNRLELTMRCFLQFQESLGKSTAEDFLELQSASHDHSTKQLAKVEEALGIDAAETVSEQMLLPEANVIPELLEQLQSVVLQLTSVKRTAKSVAELMQMAPVTAAALPNAGKTALPAPSKKKLCS